MIKKIFSWIFKDELQRLEKVIEATEKLNKTLGAKHSRVDNLLDNLQVSVDHHMFSRSWAVISIQGKKSDYIKFIDLGERDIREIQQFISRYDRSKVDCAPQHSTMFKF
jgi:hypothetical protein